RCGVDRIQRLASRHEQAVALGSAEANVADHFGDADAAEQLAFWRPYRHLASGRRPSLHGYADHISIVPVIIELHVINARLQHHLLHRRAIADGTEGQHHHRHQGPRRQAGRRAIGHDAGEEHRGSGADGEDYRDEINFTLQDLWTSGEYTALDRKWFNADPTIPIEVWP